MSDLDTRVRQSLERLTHPTDSAIHERSAVWEALVARRRRRDRRRAVAAGSATVLAGAIAIASVFLTPDGNRTEVATGDVEPSNMFNEGSVTVDGENLGSLRISTSPLRPAGVQAWLEHSVTLENVGSEDVHLDDFRQGQFLGEREVAVATEGCGYRSPAGAPVTMACRLDYRPITLAPGAEHQFAVRLWRGLAGMTAVGDDSYTWRLRIKLGSEAFTHPNEPGTDATIVVTYEHLGAEDVDDTESS